MRWHAQDCYKDIITDICNWSKAWSGFDAKYFDECTDSLEVNIPIKNKIYREAKDDNVFGGTVDPNSRVYCYDIPLIGQTNPNITASGSLFSRKFMENAYPAMGKWIYENYFSQL